MDQTQAACRMCGTCCEKGGPALHLKDLELVAGGVLRPADLITIRRGEIAVAPTTGKPGPVRHELVKLRGTGSSWRCRFHEPRDNRCSIYENRPLACRILKCWDTAPVLAIAGKDLVTRLDILPPGHPLVPLIRTHERRFPCPDLTRLAGMGRVPGSVIKSLEKAMVQDLDFRTRTVQDLGLGLDEELFAFGRPLFQLLQTLGFTVEESPRGLRLFRPRAA